MSRMNCPECGRDTGVLDTRGSANNSIRRRRYCKRCGHRFTTYEREYDADRIGKPFASVERAIRKLQAALK